MNQRQAKKDKTDVNGPVMYGVSPLQKAFECVAIQDQFERALFERFKLSASVFSASQFNKS